MISWSNSIQALEKQRENFQKSIFLRYLLAMSIPVIALFVQWLALDLIQPFIWFAFFPAVFLSSWLGGIVCGLSATILSMILVWLFFIPYNSFSHENATKYILMSAVFLATGVLFSFLHHRLTKLVRLQMFSEIDYKRRESQLHEAQRIGNFGSWAWDVKDNKVQWSDELFRLLGLQPHELTPTLGAFFERVHPEDRERLMTATNEVLKSGKSVPIDFRVLWPNGNVKIVHGVGDVYLDEKGAVTEMIGTVHDITERKIIEDAFRESETKFRGLLEMACDPVVITDVNGKIEFVNQQVKSSFGYQQDELLGQLIEVLIPEKSRLLHILGKDREFESHDIKNLGRHIQLKGKKKDGIEFPLDISLSPFKTNRGWIITAFMRDTSDQRRSEMQQRFLSNAGRVLNETIDYQECVQRIADIVVPPLADACLVHISNGELLVLKAFAHEENIKCGMIEKIFGEISLVPQHFEYGPGFVATTQSAQLIETVDDLFLRAMTNREESLFAELKSTGIRSWISVPMSARGRSVGIISLIRCASKKYTSVDLNVAQLVADRAAIAVDNARLYREAQQAIALREDMLGIVSHDLKNPLGVIKGFNENIYELLTDKNFDESAIVSTKAIARSVKQMERLINDLLDFAKIQSGTLSIEFNLNRIEDVIWEGIESIRYLADQKGIKIFTEAEADLPQLYGDRDRIRQVLANLLGNAVKFSPDDSQIKVIAKLVGSNVQFTVRDLGKGISSEYISHIFDRYWQEKETSKLGTGLGLFIAKGIIESHKGRIWVESQVGKGSAFHFTIPLKSNGLTKSEQKTNQTPIFANPTT